MGRKSLKETPIEELAEQHSKLVKEINEKLKDFPPVPTTNRDKEKKGHKYPNNPKTSFLIH